VTKHLVLDPPTEYVPTLEQEVHPSVAFVAPLAMVVAIEPAEHVWIAQDVRLPPAD